MTIGLACAIKNFGKSPVLTESDVIAAFAADAKTEPPTPLLQLQEDIVCMSAQQIRNHRAAVVFPNAVSIGGDDNIPIEILPGVKGIEHVWILVCLAYQDQAQNLYHTKISFYLSRQCGAQGRCTRPTLDLHARNWVSVIHRKD